MARNIPEWIRPGARVIVHNLLAPGMSKAGEVIAVEPHNTGMTDVLVRHDTGCERLGRDWMHAASTLRPLHVGQTVTEVLCWTVHEDGSRSIEDVLDLPCSLYEAPHYYRRHWGQHGVHSGPITIRAAYMLADGQIVRPFAFPFNMGGRI